ncbi:hypothetical protein CMV30_06170 [Nibricoccus aquaticus]|uniref:DUF2846 domain-containing protein n=1 Tax=Nibricoccus aquaticus TaxID=2576891 RepID=A0A290QI69_9BACT|nr:hypothetical protein [Nibricoccus aquaticus]ATC63572.1 hypothetical protein CMV30_06170 [Nibricoccus aquaticus]
MGNKPRISLILLCAFTLSGCAGLLQRDVTQKEPYRQFIGQRYELTKGLYIIEFVAGGLGRQLASAGDSFWQMPATLSDEFIGKKVYGGEYRIIEVAPAGSVLKLQKAEQSSHTENVFYLARIELPRGKLYEDVGTAGFIDGNSIPPSITKADFLVKR